MGKQIHRTKNIMSQSTFKSIVLTKRPVVDVIPNETFTVLENSMLTAADLKDGEVLVQSLYLSLDPAMRGWLNGLFTHIE